MTNILLEGFDIDAPWLYDELKNYLKPHHAVAVVAFSFRDGRVKSAADWDALYARKNGRLYGGIAGVSSRSRLSGSPGTTTSSAVVLFSGTAISSGASIFSGTAISSAPAAVSPGFRSSLSSPCSPIIHTMIPEGINTRYTFPWNMSNKNPYTICPTGW